MNVYMPAETDGRTLHVRRLSNGHFEFSISFNHTDVAVLDRQTVAEMVRALLAEDDHPPTDGVVVRAASLDAIAADVERHERALSAIADAIYSLKEHLL